jgi:hypothetical protein
MERAERYRRDAESQRRNSTCEKLVASSQKPLSALFSVQIGKADRIYNRFLFVWLRLAG